MLVVDKKRMEKVMKLSDELLFLFDWELPRGDLQWMLEARVMKNCKLDE